MMTVGTETDSKAEKTHHAKKERRLPALGIVVLALLTTVSLGGCPLMIELFGEPGPLAIAVAADSLTLGWDQEPDTLWNVEAGIGAFRVYVRERGTRDWTFVSEIETTVEPTFTVSSADAFAGRAEAELQFEFGVSSVTRDGEESMIHSSVDFDAQPRGGWYVVWTRP